MLTGRRRPQSHWNYRPSPCDRQPADRWLTCSNEQICGSDLHLYHSEILALQKGDILGHVSSSLNPPKNRTASQFHTFRLGILRKSGPRWQERHKAQAGRPSSRQFPDRMWKVQILPAEALVLLREDKRFVPHANNVRKTRCWVLWILAFHRRLPWWTGRVRSR